MNQEKIVQLNQGLATAFINQNIASNLAYKPQFVSNNYKEGRKVISSIEDELLSCDEFAISAAFITLGGITPLLQTFRELEQRGIPGKILTTDYLAFSDPRALRILAKFTNIELKMFVTENGKEGFHTKGYIFKKEGMYRIIVGSSNMTLSALTTNREWNTKIVSAEQGEYTQNIAAELEQLWNAERSLDFEQFIDSYTDVYTKNKIIQKQKEIARRAEVPSLEMYRLQPNSFGYSGDRVKGLIFCSRIDEAKELSDKFNEKGWRTQVLSGSDSEAARTEAIERLAGDEAENALDYIISVDIFSEGVGVPEINQVIMLRPTESPIVFIQQLGRGLRKAENKEYVVVLDFIGNYRNNFMIPIALSGDRSYNVQLFVRKNKDDKISKEFYYLGRMTSTGVVKEFVMPNTDKTAVEIEWALDTPVREDIYEYIVNG